MKQKTPTGVFVTQPIQPTRYEKYLQRKAAHPILETLKHPIYSFRKSHYDSETQKTQSLRNLQEIYSKTSTLMYEIQSNENRDLIHANHAFRQVFGVDEQSQGEMQLKDVITNTDANKAQLFDRLSAHQRKDEKIAFTLEITNQQTKEIRTIAFEELRLELPCGEHVYFGTAKDISSVVEQAAVIASLATQYVAVGTIGHEINNPLTIISVSVSSLERLIMPLLKDNSTQPQAQRLIDYIRTSKNRIAENIGKMIKMVNDNEVPTTTYVNGAKIWDLHGEEAGKQPEKTEKA